MVGYTPKRGDLVWLEFDPQKGKEIQKTNLISHISSPVQPQNRLRTVHAHNLSG